MWTFFFAAHAGLPEADLTALAARVGPSVVLLRSTGPLGEELGSGTGFFVDGGIVTNHHVIAGAASVICVLADGTELPVRGLLADDPLRDVAILAPLPGEHRALPLGSSRDLAAGQEVAVIGSPMGLSASLTVGVVSAVRQGGIPEKLREDNEGLASWGLQISAAIAPGSSGSPILTRAGDVVGVAVGVLHNDGNDLNFGIPVEVVRELTATLPAEPVSFSAEADRARTMNLGISAAFFAMLGAGWLWGRHRAHRSEAPARR